jgi:hypothetical protein
MSINTPADQPSSSSSAPTRKILLKESQLSLKDSQERKIFKELKNKAYTHTPILDLTLLHEIGMDAEFNLIFPLVGWDSFWDITELGSKLLTIEFLCTLETTEDGVRFFQETFNLTWRELSNHLGFHPRATIDLDDALPGFEKKQFWKEMTGEDFYFQARTNSIQLPTLHFLHKWMGYAMFPRDDIRKIRVGDLQLLYAALKKIRVSPIRLLVAHCFFTHELMGHVGCTSLITRLATNLGALNNSLVNFIEEARPCYGYESFRHARILKREHDGLYMIFENRGRLQLPNLGLSLYTVQVLIVDV